jgi:hypothetical protein
MNRDLPFSANGRPSPKKNPAEPKPETASAKDPLVVAYDELNALWNQAETDFAAMRVPITVSNEASKHEYGPPDEAPLGMEETSLEWARHQNQWRICWVKCTNPYDQDSWRCESKPIAECPMDVRVNMARHLRKLRYKMREARKNYLPEVLEAIAKIKEALAD